MIQGKIEADFKLCQQQKLYMHSNPLPYLLLPLSRTVAGRSLHKLLEVIKRKELNIPVHQAEGGFILC